MKFAWMTSGLAAMGLLTACGSHGPHGTNGMGAHARLVQLLHGGEAGGHDHGSGHDSHDVGEHVDRMAENLELTVDQRRELGALLQREIGPLMSNVETLLAVHADQARAIHGEVFDEAAIRDASRKVSAAQEELAVALGRVLRDTHALLTPKQIEQAKDLHAGHDFGSMANDRVGEVARSLRAWADRQ